MHECCHAREHTTIFSSPLCDETMSTKRPADRTTSDALNDTQNEVRVLWLITPTTALSPHLTTSSVPFSEYWLKPL